MARTLEIPAVVGLKNITGQVKDGEFVIIDGNAGEEQLEAYKKVLEAMAPKPVIIRTAGYRGR